MGSPSTSAVILSIEISDGSIYGVYVESSVKMATFLRVKDDNPETSEIYT